MNACFLLASCLLCLVLAQQTQAMFGDQEILTVEEAAAQDKCEDFRRKRKRNRCNRIRNQGGGGSKGGGSKGGGGSKVDERICGTDGITYKNFRKFTIAQSNNPSLFERNSGPCGKDSCDRNCGKSYNPVCATDGETYDNTCQLQVANCKDNNIQLEYPGECRQTDRCDRNCGRNYNPVCASNGRTYDNTCELLVANCRFSNIRFAHHGECRDQFQDRCDRNCGHNYNPVCGTDGATYDNTCLLLIANCRDDRIRLAHHGQCTQIDRCDRNCGLNFNPVCGTDGETYANTCHLLVANCRDAFIRLAHRGQCIKTHQCGTACIDQGLQFCGSDNNIYTSHCALENARCFNPQLREVPCPAPPPPPPVNTCEYSCDDTLSPVCGTDGVTYRNPCFYTAANCRSPSTTRFHSHGHCPLQQF